MQMHILDENSKNHNNVPGIVSFVLSGQFENANSSSNSNFMWLKTHKNKPKWDNY